ncbi:hypothetical protein [Actinoplanes derwentensis]|uniref:Uncharacterized protein n=1 Tax=Actinoplanes derwentensis TaxID=113562 RepID=A0A1H2CVH4_9ACTN|nr:hypothetical protein [Actinoplanes derwentensis]GID82066.1 hypothetical protein Ade03nite_09900 [Actinoplanes derwentensis]SDT74528.1 hypothetical protein SAMN04489716_7010 [Actinoplanes derwentensis]
MTDTPEDRWKTASLRAWIMASAGSLPSYHLAYTFDHALIRDVLALVIYARATRDEIPAADVTIGQITWHLLHDDVTTLLTQTDLTAPEVADGPADTLHWLGRSYDPQHPPDMPHGRGLGGTGLEIGLHATHSAIGTILTDRHGHGPFRQGDRVLITGGEHAGTLAVIRTAGWYTDHANQTMITDPPAGYAVHVPGRVGDLHIDLQDLTADTNTPTPA